MAIDRDQLGGTGAQASGRSPVREARPSARVNLSNGLALVGGFALGSWALGALLGTGIGYDHPVVGLFGGGAGAALWRLAKALFLGALASATIKTAVENMDDL